MLRTLQGATPTSPFPSFPEPLGIRDTETLSLHLLLVPAQQVAGVPHSGREGQSRPEPQLLSPPPLILNRRMASSPEGLRKHGRMNLSQSMQALWPVAIKTRSFQSGRDRKVWPGHGSLLHPSQAQKSPRNSSIRCWLCKQCGETQRDLQSHWLELEPGGVFSIP